MADSKVETTGHSAAMADSKVETSAHAAGKSMLTKWMNREEKETGGDEFVFWMEANAIDSTQRINSLDAKVCQLYGESVNLAVASYVSKRYSEGEAGAAKNKEALLAALGLFSDECAVLLEEYVISAAELCIKKMRLNALVDKCDKQRTLMIDIVNARMIRQEIQDKFKAFIARKHQLLQTSHGRFVIPQNDVGAAPDKSSKIQSLGSLLSNVKLDAGVTRNSFRVLVEMMRGVKTWQQSVSGLDYAMKLGGIWFEAVIGKCIEKVWVGAIADGHPVFEVLKSEIARNWKREKEVKDRFVNYQRERAHLAQGFVTKGGPELHVEGDDTIKEKNSGVGAVVEGETIEVKKTVVEGDEAVKENYIGVGDVAVKEENIGVETVQEKKSEGVAVVEGGEAVKEKNFGVETVVEGEESIREKKTEGRVDVVEVKKRLKSGVVTVVECDETIEVKKRLKSEVVTVVGCDKTMEMKKSEGSVVVKGDEAIKEKNIGDLEVD